MNKFMDLLTLKNLKGSRTQYTVIVGIAINALVQLGIVHWTPEQVQTVNNFLIMLGAYFFADKVSK